jgi:hypothetical protein
MLDARRGCAPRSTLHVVSYSDSASLNVVRTAAGETAVLRTHEGRVVQSETHGKA